MKTNKAYQKPETETIELILEESIVAGSEVQIGDRDPGSIGITGNTSFFKNNDILKSDD